MSEPSGSSHLEISQNLIDKNKIIKQNYRDEKWLNSP